MFNIKNKSTKGITMNDLNETMDEAIINDDFNKIESIALNPNHALVRMSQYNMFTDQVSFVNKWVNISEVFKELWDDINTDCHDYIMDLPQYKNMDFDQMVEDYDFKDQKQKKESMTKYIYKKNSFDNSLEVSNYPWGFKLKTKRKYWIESNKTQGDRLCFCTLNPKTEKWCAVKKSTYNAVELLYIADNGYIKSDGIYKYGVNEEEIKNFLSEVDYEQLNDLQKKQILKLKAMNKVMEKVTFKIAKVSEYNLSDPLDLIRMRRDNNSDETKAREQEQDKIKSQISSAINSTYNQALVKNNLK